MQKFINKKPKRIKSKGETVINLIIATHGEMSKYTLELSKMVLGEFDNLSSVTFLPGEGPDDLVRKYEETLASFNNEYGTLFLVDIFGGSPYNAASRLVVENENMDIITGVNVPMLLELLDARDNIDAAKELAEVAKESGKSGIQSFSEIFQSMSEKNQELDDLDDLGEL